MCDSGSDPGCFPGNLTGMVHRSSAKLHLLREGQNDVFSVQMLGRKPPDIIRGLRDLVREGTGTLRLNPQFLS